MPRGIDLDRAAQLTAVAAAEHDGRFAEVAHDRCQRLDRRRLAGAADMVVADAEHGDAGVEPVPPQAFRGDGAVKRAKRPQ